MLVGALGCGCKAALLRDASPGMGEAALAARKFNVGPLRALAGPSHHYWLRLPLLFTAPAPGAPQALQESLVLLCFFLFFDRAEL